MVQKVSREASFKCSHSPFSKLHLAERSKKDLREHYLKYLLFYYKNDTPWDCYILHIFTQFSEILCKLPSSD